MKLIYPKVLSEDETVDLALGGRSLARYGDGELRLALGGTSASQCADQHLAKELQEILARSSEVLPCIPNVVSKSPKRINWEKYATLKFVSLYRLKCYGSSFITRPDSAPWIDRPSYWAKVKLFWENKDVTLVIGSERSLTVEKMPGAKSVRVVRGMYRDSYSVIDQLVEDVGRPSHIVIICLGAAGTVMAARLAKRGVWAVDLGHIGLMLKHAGTGKWERGRNLVQV